VVSIISSTERWVSWSVSGLKAMGLLNLVLCSMSFLVYILGSLKYPRMYVGQTDNMSFRLEAHNSGSVRSTKAYRPWEIIYTEDSETRGDAIRREKWLKTRMGRKFIKTILSTRAKV
jgi:putative endonuclease